MTTAIFVALERGSMSGQHQISLLAGLGHEGVEPSGTSWSPGIVLRKGVGDTRSNRFIRHFGQDAAGLIVSPGGYRGTDSMEDHVHFTDDQVPPLLS